MHHKHKHSDNTGRHKSNPRNKWILIVASIILLLVISILISYLSFINRTEGYNPNKTIAIIGWNLQIFGDKKASDTELVNKYTSILENHDVMIVQEIRDSDGSAFAILCSKFKNYTCRMSTRAGRTTSKEQYGIIYRYPIRLIDVKDYNPDSSDRWERPPIKIVFIDEKTNYTFSLYTIHIKPDDAKNEIIELDNLLSSENSKSNTVILGDFNADCSYYSQGNEFKNWKWIVKNSDDTTSGSTNCAYDRILLNQNMSSEFLSYDIDKETTADMSDHYPVSVLVRDYDYVKDNSFKKFILWIIGQ